LITVIFNPEKPPRLAGTPPEEGKLYAFPSFGGVPIGRGGFLGVVKEKVSFENEFPSPDGSGILLCKKTNFS
jgi:hypothetical protein